MGSENILGPGGLREPVVLFPGAITGPEEVVDYGRDDGSGDEPEDDVREVAVLRGDGDKGEGREVSHRVEGPETPEKAEEGWAHNSRGFHGWGRGFRESSHKGSAFRGELTPLGVFDNFDRPPGLAGGVEPGRGGGGGRGNVDDVEVILLRGNWRAVGLIPDGELCNRHQLHRF
jgi:hypothetical protein